MLVNGRISRFTYFKRSFIAIFISVITGIYLSHPAFNFLILIGIIYFLIQTIKRLHDLNVSGWFTFIMLIPMINLLFGIFVMLRKGIKGNNRYGLEPK